MTQYWPPRPDQKVISQQPQQYQMRQVQQQVTQPAQQKQSTPPQPTVKRKG